MGTLLDCYRSMLVSLYSFTVHSASSPRHYLPHSKLVWPLRVSQAVTTAHSKTLALPSVTVMLTSTETVLPTTPSGPPSTSVLAPAPSGPLLILSSALQQGTVSTSSSNPVVLRGDCKSVTFPSVVSQLGLGGGAQLCPVSRY